MVNVPVSRPSWVVRYRVAEIIYAAETFHSVYLRSPSWLDEAEEALPYTDSHSDSYCLGLTHVEPFLAVEDAVAPALRLRGVVHEVRLINQQPCLTPDPCALWPDAR